MTTCKTAILDFRIALDLKVALRIAVAQVRRSVANMVEVMIRDSCGRNSVAVQAPIALPNI